MLLHANCWLRIFLSGSTVYEKYRGVETRLTDIINTQVLEIANFIDSGATYRPYIAKW